MQPFQRVRQLFEDALDQPEAGRLAWLQAAAGGDQGLIAEVLQLLAADANPAPVLDHGPAVTRLPPLGEQLLGARIGSFRILRELGSGGMGTVFEAEQERPRRLVALKVMRHGFGGPRARARFEYEAEVLARLQHPGIAQVYEAGVFEHRGQAQPYFAMERIDGARPLDQFVREQRLDPPAVLQLFCRVCDAVHHGHQRGVVHRDLKPQNVLVDQGGNPKLIDFGIARADGAALQATLVSDGGAAIGTLAYMSPEQLDLGGAATDIRVDVYALGVVLFQLLAGRLPLELGELSLGAATDAIRHREPPRLSACAARALPHDLDWVVSKAMAKDPEQRYASAQALREDLGRLLRGEPVLAGPPSTAYRLRKFVRRNRLAVAAAAAVLLALVLGTVATAIGWRRAVAAEELAAGRQQQAEQMAEHLYQVTQLQSEILGSARGDQNVRLADVVQRAQQRLLAIELPDLVAAELHAALGVSLDSLGLTAPARAQFEAAQRRIGDRGEAMPRTALLVQTQYANLLAGIGGLQQAEAMLRQALQFSLRRFGEGHELTARVRGNLASLLGAKHDHAGAEALYALALPVLERSPGKQHFATITAMTGRASGLHKLHRDEEARRLFVETSALAAEALGAEDPTTLSCENAYAAFELETGEVEAARARLERVVELRTRVSGAANPTTLRACSNLAVCHERAGRYPEAVAIYRTVLAARAKAGGGKELADLITRFNLGVALHLQDRPETLAEALAVLQATVADAEQLLPADNWQLAVMRQHHGIVLRKLGRFAEAEAALAAARAVLDRFGAGDDRLRTNWQQTAKLYEEWGRPADAAAWRAKLAAR